MYNSASIVRDSGNIWPFCQAFCEVSVFNKRFDLESSIRIGKDLNRKEANVGPRFFGTGPNVARPHFGDSFENAIFALHRGDEQAIIHV